MVDRDRNATSEDRDFNERVKAPIFVEAILRDNIRTPN